MRIPSANSIFEDVKDASRHSIALRDVAVPFGQIGFFIAVFRGHFCSGNE